MDGFGKIPEGCTLDVEPFKAHTPEQALEDLKQLLQILPIFGRTYENSHPSVHRRYGISRDWLIEARDYWLNSFSWRKQEDYTNSFPQFKATVTDGTGYEIELHFVALFARRPDAIPIAFYHGWPGSFCEFLPMLDILRSRHTPDSLPYHIIVPSLPGFAYSSGPPLDSDFSLARAATALHNLMIGLGFSDGYLVQGGDVGSFIARYQAIHFDACKGMHLNHAPLPTPKNADSLPLADIERKALPRGDVFHDTGMAYAFEHGTRTATIGLCLASSPIALLSWIGEKFLEWSDEDLPLHTIVSHVALYWLTDTITRCLYPYRGMSNDDERPRMAKLVNSKGPPSDYVDKPCGFSFFPKELIPMPTSWVRTSCNLVSSSIHESGGHFAALEKPEELLADVEEWIALAWKS